MSWIPLACNSWHRGLNPFQLAGTLVSVATLQHGLYLLRNQNQGLTPGAPTAMLYAVLFDRTIGQAFVPQAWMPASDNAIGMPMDSFGENLVISSGQTCGSMWFLQLSPADGTISTSNSGFLPCEEFATPIAFDHDHSDGDAFEQSQAAIFLGPVRTTLTFN